jgi:hypothetical protein
MDVLDMSTMDQKNSKSLNGLSMVVMNIIWDGGVRYVHHGSKES